MHSEVNRIDENARPEPVDVLLAHGFLLVNDTKQQQEKRRPYPPLATLYAASRLRDRGYRVALFDATLEPDLGAFERSLGQLQPRAVALFEDSFNFLSKMCLGHVRQATLGMIELCRGAGVERIAVHSSDASDHPATYLDGGAAFIMIGEAERTLSELVDHLLSSCPERPDSIPGLAWRDASGLRRSPDSVPERDLDALPFPAWDLVDIDVYREFWQRSHGEFSLNMVTTRGCPYSCNWCAKPIWGKSYATRSPANVAEEMALLKTGPAPDHIWFADDIFGLKPGWIEAFADEVAKQDALIPFTVQSRADLIDASAAEALRRAGCREIWLGAESGSQKILDAMDKGIRVADIHNAVQLLKGQGLRACLFIQLGYPDETFDDIKATVKMVWDTLPDDVGVSVSYPLPGTPFYQRVERAMEGKRNWTESNDLDMMFQGNYESQFYRRLRRYLHDGLAVRRRQAAAAVPAPALNDDALALSAEWEALKNAEARYRNPRATQLADLPISDARPVTT